ncbi:trehalose-phosphatase [Parvularcula sp. ZS-1/3]|uniref:Trehalose 6-phosphate phosphatase n=1 Tax=Parvularcula mediterranea TaxID=2732508 RepID=A0A7Y3RNH4_9PROT|nr:trehalose-phosphatase [Parvularcula mediterranea]NNU16826.1 trehalose-phosphatase [Parvularcula mediterranea]
MGLITAETALFLDFDGTLAPLQDDPDAVGLPEGGAELLLGLSEKLGGALALVSGRDARDLSRRVPNALWRAGNHGDMIIPPGTDEPSKVETAPAALLEGAKALADRLEGVRLEEKARVICIHSRTAPQHADEIAQKVEELAAAVGGYKVQRGKDIVELKPEGVDKGAAIERLMTEDAFRGRKPLFIGDDTTDEDGFIVCIHRGGSAVKVGEGKTLAPHRLSSTDDVWEFLKGTLHDLA